KTLINLVSLEADIQKELGKLVTQRVAVSCDGAYRVNERGDSFECDVVGRVTAGADRIESVLVKVGTEGDVSWQEIRVPDGSAVPSPPATPTASETSQPTGEAAVAANPAAGADTTAPSETATSDDSTRESADDTVNVDNDDD
ncbi:MAG: hypothetical protein AAFU71_06045, partial [Cyanobacteria bacterium J06632_22]